MMGITKIFNFVFSFFIVLLISCQPNNKLELTKNGVSKYEIVHIGIATESQYKSAEILQTYIQKISNIKLSIVDESSQNGKKHKIYIGKITDEDLDPQQIKANNHAQRFTHLDYH